ncbi:hypothetical protein [Bacteroides salyersiae]|uniref:hypothetical protein n=1 Tax=Bacteroides salyersiae TaxID=291644 RepID=UPI00216645EF|nr:hypothetical protein [Bacteroides salyersiae]MCS3057461.1 hypothetical protein [Bacteroides salyersiae]
MLQQEYYISRDPVIYDGYPYNETFLGERQFVLTSTIDGGDDAGRKAGLNLGYGEMIIGTVYGNFVK